MRRFHMIALLCLASCVAACGIPVGSQPNVIPRHNVPLGLLSPTVIVPTTTTQPTQAYVQESIYLLNAEGNALALSREFPVPATLQGVLSALISGPTSSEAATGITTALPTLGKVLSAITVNGLATINLNSAFAQIPSAAETQVVGQLVLTATAQTGVNAVLFEINSKPISVPVSSGAVTSDPVTAAQYKALLG